MNVIADGIYEYENFLSQDEIDRVLLEVKNVEDWHVGEYFTNTMATYNTRTVDYLKERIQNLEWMGDATKKRALIKLASFTRKLGYPDKAEEMKRLLNAL